MTRDVLLGDLPRIKTGLNKGRLDRPSTAELLGYSEKELSKAYNNWIQIFRKEGSTLSFEEYLTKLTEAGIRPDNVGNRITDYHLCRVNDEGGYRNDNCSFKVKSINIDEQKKTNAYYNAVKKYGEDKAKEIWRETGKNSWTSRRNRPLA